MFNGIGCGPKAIHKNGSFYSFHMLSLCDNGMCVCACILLLLLLLLRVSKRVRARACVILTFLIMWITHAHTHYMRNINESE